MIILLLLAYEYNFYLFPAHRHEQTSEYVLLRWLREHGLSHYFEGFIQSGIIHLSDVAQLNLPDEDLYDELEITLPGHQRRLEHAGLFYF